MSNFYKLLGRQIAHFRHAAGLTQEQLAEKTDYSVDFIGLVERGVNAPTVARLKDIADVLSTEVWQLFYPTAVTQAPSAATKLKKNRAKIASRKHRAR